MRYTAGDDSQIITACWGEVTIQPCKLDSAAEPLHLASAKRRMAINREPVFSEQAPTHRFSIYYRMAE